MSADLSFVGILIIIVAPSSPSPRSFSIVFTHATPCAARASTVRPGLEKEQRQGSLFSSALPSHSLSSASFLKESQYAGTSASSPSLFQAPSCIVQ